MEGHRGHRLTDRLSLSQLVTSGKIASILTQLCSYVSSPHCFSSDLAWLTTSRLAHSNSQARFCPAQLSPLTGLTCAVPKLLGFLSGSTSPDLLPVTSADPISASRQHGHLRPSPLLEHGRSLL